MTKSMIVLVDSREKKNSHILGCFDKQGISYQVGELEYGDYSFMIPAAAADEDIFFTGILSLRERHHWKNWAAILHRKENGLKKNS